MHLWKSMGIAILKTGTKATKSSAKLTLWCPRGDQRQMGPERRHKGSEVAQ